ncbi:precorrin-6Y C5,15-methyltransferase (decarboxylating) [Eubacterium ruminantium]|nr:precorrin-6Y C5,15-methyltransferase (decarboxylating) [Eubacterium ruminantium]
MAVKNINITLAGAGMGSENCLTEEVKFIINKADILFGAERMVSQYQQNEMREIVDSYRVGDLIDILNEKICDLSGRSCLNVVFVFSGDSGFYSGAEKSYLKLKEWAEGIKSGNNDIEINIDIKAGISSVSYLAARLGVSWQEAGLYSLHGRDFEDGLPGVIESVKYNEKTFVLLSGRDDVIRLQLSLTDMEKVTFTLGYRLSYTDERIISFVPGTIKNDLPDGLYTAFIKNDETEVKSLSYGIPTESFIREEGVPITKEEIRSIVLSKLRLYRGCTFYDIGSGTGGVSIDVAGISPDIKVVSIEKRPERTGLLQKNMERFRLKNIKALTGSAEELLASEDHKEFFLKNPPDRVFIGGTEGRLRDIINQLKIFGRSIRICMTAVTIETKNEIFKLVDEGVINTPDIVEAGISRYTELGRQHMMKHENTVMIATFEI